MSNNNNIPTSDTGTYHIADKYEYLVQPGDLVFTIKHPTNGYAIQALVSDYDEYLGEIIPELTEFEAMVCLQSGNGVDILPVEGPARYFGSEAELARVLEYAHDSHARFLALKGFPLDELDGLVRDRIVDLGHACYQRDLDIEDLIEEHGIDAMRIASTLIKDGVKFSEAIEAAISI